MQGKILFSILLAFQATKAISINLKQINANQLLLPFTMPWTLDQIEKFYQEFCFNKLDYRFKHKGSIPLMFKEIADFENWRSSEQFFSDKNSIIDKIAFILGKNQVKVSREDFSGALADLKNYYKQLAKNYVGLKLDPAFINEYFVKEDHLRSAIELFKVQSKFSFLQTEPTMEILLPELIVFTNKELSEYANFMVFQNELNNQVQKILDAIVQKLLNDSPSLSNSEAEIAVTKVIVLLQTMGELFDSIAHPLLQIADYTKQQIFLPIDKQNLDYRNTNYLVLLLTKIFALYKKSHSMEIMRAGKELFLDFFSPSNYQRPSITYVRFVMRKYAKEGLRFNPKAINTPAVDKARGLYIYDLLNSSLEIRKEILSGEELDLIFGSFGFFIENIDKALVGRFEQFRKMFIYFQEEIEQNESLFDGLYVTGLWSTYFTMNTGLFSNTYGTFGLEFDSFLDRAYSYSFGKLLKYINPLMSESVFKTNIQSNYVFYKMLNLAVNYPEFISQGKIDTIKFYKYSDFDDKEIEEFVFGMPGNNVFISFLMHKAFNSKSNNLNYLEGLKISENELQKFVKGKQIENQKATIMNLKLI